MKMDDHRLSYHIRMAEFTSTLCSGDLLPMKATYALTANKVKSQGTIDRDEALIRFTRKYFQSRQPATLEDFVWWSGLNVSDCRKGIALLGDSIHVEKWKGREFYLTDDCRTRGFRKGRFPTTNTSSATSPATLCSLLSIVIMPTTTAASSSPSSPTTALSVAIGHPSRMTVWRCSLLRPIQRTSLRRGSRTWIIVRSNLST